LSSPRLSVHDHFQLELKLDHPLAGVPEGLGFEAWIFFPPSLGIDEPAFRKDAFYEDLSTYVRFQTPKMSLGRLFGDGDRTSPFEWLARHEARLTSGAATDADFAMALRELRLFAAVFRAIVRDETRYVSGEVRKGVPPSVLADHVAASLRFLSEVRDALQRFRALRVHFLDARTPAPLRAALHAIDDFLSIQALEGWFALLEAYAPHPVGNDAADALRAAIQGETIYRGGAGHLCTPTADPTANEPYVTRVNQLKKWVLAVLHLRLASSRRAQRLQDALFGIAAGAAMTVAVVLQLVALWTVGTPTSPQVGGTTLFAFVGAAVGGYILKDSLKERLKIWFRSGIPEWLYDRRQNLRVEESGETIGFIEETVRLVRPGELANVVGRLREEGEDLLFASHRAEEDVIHYRRQLRVDGERARVHGPEMSAINEILRLNVGRWLRRMDEPTRELYRLEPGGAIGRVEALKTYRVTLIVARTRRGTEPRYQKYVLVLTRSGILRVEEQGGF
jgi:hypothetical protein